MLSLDEARAAIDKALSQHSRPAVMCSFGKDSMLLLHLVRERCEPAVIWLGHDAESEQFQFINRIVCEWDLTLFKVPPTKEEYLVRAPNGEYSLVREYVLNGVIIPVISDVVHSDKWCLKSGQRVISQNMGVPFDCIFTGWKESDTHPIFGNSPIPYPANGSSLCGMTWYAPLREMTDADVWEATQRLNIPYNEAKYRLENPAADPDSTLVCTKCKTGTGRRVYCHLEGKKIRRDDWDGEHNRQHFLNKFFGL